MTKGNAKKICIVVSSLGGGGAERSSALLSELLFDLGYDVHIVSVLDKIDYSYKGELLNLGKLKSQDNSILGRLKRLKVFKNYLKEYDFDYVIDNRTRLGLKEIIISKLIYNSKKTIYCVHSYNTKMYINPSVFLGKFLYNSAYKIVCVANEISNKLKSIYEFKSLEVIYNHTHIQSYHRTNVNDNDFILFYGRVEDDVKNISLLIEAYTTSRLAEKQMKLKILGDGKDKGDLIAKVKDLNLTQHIEFLEFQNDPFGIVNNAYFTILTSRFEGFPMVLVESLSLGTPVVSVDCKSGPSEIISDEYNGLLVENYNVEELAKAMNRMLENKDLYLRCKSNAKKSVEKFSKDQIAMQWQSILK